MPSNQAAWLHKADSALEVGEAPMPLVGPNEIVVKNAAITINPLDWHMSKMGIFIQQWPAIFGCDVAGTVHEVGSGVAGRFKVGDRVIGHTINLVTGRAQDGAFALYTTVPADKAAILPDNIPFTSGVVIPLALEAAICALSVSEPGTALLGVSIPTLGLSLPSLEPASINKVLVVYGGSASVGSMTIQLATAAGIQVIAVSGKNNFDLSKEAGAVEVFDYKGPEVVEKVVKAVRSLTKRGAEFVGIVDAISIPETYKHDLAILAQLGGGNLACTHPPPPAEEVPGNVKAGMVFAVNDAATPVWKEFVGQALAKGVLKCLPPATIVGKGLEFIQEGLERSEAGVSGTKLVVEI